MRNYEKIEKTIFSCGYLKLITTVTNGQKNNSTGDRLNSMYLKSYNSQKYNDRDQLESLIISTGDYLVASYKEFKDGSMLGEDVYMSYKHLSLFKLFLDEVYNTFIENIESVYGKKSVTKEYSDIFVTSEPMIGDKTISGYAEKCQTEDGLLYNGIMFVINSQDEGNSFYQEMSVDTFITLKEIIDNYNLSLECSLANISGMLYQLLDGGSSSEHRSSGGNSSSMRGGRKRPSALPSRFKKNSSNNENDDDEEYEDDAPRPSKKKVVNNKPNQKPKVDVEDDDDEEDEIPVKKSSSKKPTAKTTTKDKTKKIKSESFSLDDIINDEDDFDLDDDVNF